MNEDLCNIDIAAPADADALAEAERRTFSDPWSHDAIASQIADTHAIVLCAKDASGALAGYALGSFIAGEGELFRIATLLPYRRRGLGKALLRSFTDELRRRGTEVVFLEVRASNDSAISLYEGAGFERYAVRRSYYKAPSEDAVMMRLELGT